MSTFAFSDLHAQYNLWKQIKDYIKPEDTVYCLGDCVDRGDVGLEILNEVMETPNIILLRGNHEDFINSIGSEIVSYMKYNFDENINQIFPNVYLWRANGADKTIEAFKELSQKEKICLIEKIKKLPTHAEYTNSNGDIIYLCHAGRQPDTAEIQDMHKGDIPMNNYIWDRDHLMESHWNGKDNEYCVHGHTPAIYMRYYVNMNPSLNFPIYTNANIESAEIVKYCDNHKINIDLGSFETHKACLLNLDTFEPIYFKDKNYFTKEK